MNYPPPPPGGYGGPPGGYGGPPQGGYGPPPAGYGPPPPAPGMGGAYGPAMGGMGMMQPNAPFGVDPMTGMPFSDKSKMIAGMLNIGCALIGIGGVGRFYTGHIGLGVAQLLIGWATCGLWPIIDGIFMLMGKVPDAQGRPLRD